MIGQGIPAEQKENDSEQQKKTREVIALKQTDGAQRTPAAKQQDDHDRAKCRLDEHAGPGRGVTGLWFFFCLFRAVALLSGELAEERTSQQKQTNEPRDRAINLAQGRPSWGAAELQHFGGRFLNRAEGGAAEKQARVCGPRNHDVLRGLVFA